MRTNAYSSMYVLARELQMSHQVHLSHSSIGIITHKLPKTTHSIHPYLPSTGLHIYISYALYLNLLTGRGRVVDRRNLCISDLVRNKTLGQLVELIFLGIKVTELEVEAGTADKR